MKKTLSMLLLVLFVVGFLVSCNADAVENLFKDKIQQYTVTFNTNGGSEVPSQEVLSGNKVNKPEDPTKDGYTFDGWYKEEACTTPWNFDTDTITANTTLYAKWTANTYPITYKDLGNYDFSGTHGASYPTSHTYGTTTNLVSPTKTGYTFDGWFKNSDCSGTAITSLGETEYTSDITLYAKWTENPPAPVSVTGVSLDKTAIKLREGDTDTLTATIIPDDATNQNVTWSSSNESVATVSNGTVTAIATGTAIITVTTTDGSKTATCTVTVEKPTYTVTFDLNGIDGTEPEAKTIKSGEKVTKPDDPTDEKHTFAGWYTTKDATTGKLSGEWNFDNNVTKDMILYAKWTRRISAIIETVDFPVIIDYIPADAWIDSSNPNNKVYSQNENDILFVADVNDIHQRNPLLQQFYGGSTSDGAYKSGNSYIYSNDSQHYAITFKMTSEDNLENIKIDALAGADENIQKAAGTYTAPLATLTMNKGWTEFDYNKITITIKCSDIKSGKYYFAKTDEISGDLSNLVENNGKELTNDDILQIKDEGLSIVKDGLEAETAYKTILVVSDSKGNSQTITTVQDTGEVPPP